MIVFCFLEINRRELFKFAAIPHNYGLNNHEKRADSVIAISSFLLGRRSLDIVFLTSITLNHQNQMLLLLYSL